MTTAPARAALLLIGDELLSGKIRDENGHYFAKTARRLGLALREVAIVGDDMDAIGDAVLRLGAAAEFVFTSGGVGPTHDDLTMAAIARASGRALVQHAQMAAALLEHYGPGISAAALSMADVPEGTVLRGDQGWPTMRLDLDRPNDPVRTRLYILPGVPMLFRAKLEALERTAEELPRGEGWHVATVLTALDESVLASHLNAVVAEFSVVEIGSYPKWVRGDDGRLVHQVQITLEAPLHAHESVEQARQALVQRLGRLT